MLIDGLSLAGSKAVPEPNERVPMKTLGQNEFLKLLVTKMQNQDPMSPMEDTEFIGQMAQFTSLEQARQMREDMNDLKNREGFQQAVGLMGQQVTVKVDKDETLTGTVSEVKVTAGVASVVINNNSYALQDVIHVLAKDGTVKTATK